MSFNSSKIRSGKKVLFLGLGHLGLFFLKENHTNTIVGTRRNIHQKTGIALIQYTLGQKWISSEKFDIIIVSFPPVKDYALKLKELLNDLGPFDQVIFISSTSIFRSGHITENSEKVGLTPNGQELIECEQLIETLENYVIIRPGGLIDSLRNPKKIAKKMTTITKSQTNVNLVHTSDVAAFLNHVIDRQIVNETYNLVCSDHPSKELFYGRFNSQITFKAEKSEIRVIDNSKSKSIGFRYHFDDLSWC